MDNMFEALSMKNINKFLKHVQNHMILDENGERHQVSVAETGELLGQMQSMCKRMMAFNGTDRTIPGFEGGKWQTESIVGDEMVEHPGTYATRFSAPFIRLGGSCRCVPESLENGAEYYIDIGAEPGTEEYIERESEVFNAIKSLGTAYSEFDKYSHPTFVKSAFDFLAKVGKTMGDVDGYTGIMSVSNITTAVNKVKSEMDLKSFDIYSEKFKDNDFDENFDIYTDMYTPNVAGDLAALDHVPDFASRINFHIDVNDDPNGIVIDYNDSPISKEMPVIKDCRICLDISDGGEECILNGERMRDVPIELKNFKFENCTVEVLTDPAALSKITGASFKNCSFENEWAANLFKSGGCELTECIAFNKESDDYDLNSREDEKRPCKRLIFDDAAFSYDKIQEDSDSFYPDDLDKLDEFE